MKKMCMFFCFLFSTLFCTFSIEPISSNWTGTNSGDYVIYKDNSWKEPAWIGFLYYNANTIGSFLYTAKGKTVIKILFTGEELNGEFVITGQNIISGANNDSNYIYGVNYLMEILPKLYAWKREPTNKSIVIKRASEFINEAQFGGENEIRFSSYIPLFHIESILDKESRPIFTLEEIGLTQDEKQFFDFSPIESIEIRNSDFALNENAEKKPIAINGIYINLDSQWEQIADNSFLLGNEAFLVVTPVDLQNMPGEKNDFLIKYLSSSGKLVKVLAAKTDISGSANNFKIKNQVYDCKTKTIKYDIKLIKNIEDSKYIITGLTVDKSIYEKYKNYFDNLF